MISSDCLRSRGYIYVHAFISMKSILLSSPWRQLLIMFVQTLLQFVDQYYTFCPQSMTDINNEKSKSDLDDAIVSSAKSRFPTLTAFQRMIQWEVACQPFCSSSSNKNFNIVSDWQIEKVSFCPLTLDGVLLMVEFWSCSLLLHLA